MKLHVSAVLAGILSLAAVGATTMPDASLSFRVFGCQTCDDDCGFGEHEADADLQGDWSTSVASHGSGSHGCDPGSCSDYHQTGCQMGAMVRLGWTGLDRVAVSEITDAVEAATSEELPDVLRMYRDALIFNEERHSLQVLGCSGELVANLPLSDVDVVALSE